MSTEVLRIVSAKPLGVALSLPYLLRLAPALALCAMSGLAQAEIVSRTDVTYFTVDGATPAEIYRNILDRGPRVGGARALASISTQATQDGGLEQKGGACRVTDYVITLDFVIQRPRIVNEQVLSAADRARWQQMNVFIAAHEGQHKSVWQACAAGLEKKIDVLRAPTCSDLTIRAEALWQAMLASCDNTQRSFDAAQSKALMQQPFMLRALEGAK